MIYDIDIAKQVAKSLLQINAIILQPNNPFKWAAGWNSPIYCDNRKTLSYPEIRTFIRTSLASVINNHYKGASVIAGVATAGIPHGAHPGAYERSIGQKETAELAVMVDTFKPLMITKQAQDIELKNYYKSWIH